MVKDQPLRVIIQRQIVSCMECGEVRTAVSFKVRQFAAVDCHSCGTGEAPVLHTNKPAGFVGDGRLRRGLTVTALVIAGSSRRLSWLTSVGSGADLSPLASAKPRLEDSRWVPGSLRAPCFATGLSQPKIVILAAQARRLCYTPTNQQFYWWAAALLSSLMQQANFASVV